MQNIGDIVVIELNNDLGNGLRLEVRQERISDVIGKLVENVGFLLMIKERPKLVAGRWWRSTNQVGDITGRHVGQV